MTTQSGTERGASYDPSVQNPEPAKTSVFEDFIDIFYAPTAVFVRRAASGYGMQLLIVTVLAGLFAFANRSVFAQIFDVEYQRGVARAMAANPNLTADMMERGRGMQEALATVFSYVGTPIFIFILSLFVWIAAKVVSAQVNYSRAVLITTMAWVPRIVGSLIMTVQIVLMDTSNVTNMFSLSISPARFMDADATNGKLFGLAGSLDLFNLWSVLLVAIGVSAIGKVSRGRGLAAGAILFAVGMLPLMFR